ncbi:MAG: sulfotransferase domain-containing protein [Endozoicomonadaceae bacterium]|nr:sulfotransferase domain-containing protein [Endozoicomonadaceae bacterium]
MNLPIVNFLIIGSMKSGTTTLSDYLSLNEEIAMCDPKEPQFFSQFYDKGIAYYESQWTQANKICGEASTCYSRWPFYLDVAEKIALYNPKLKLIYIMRHPVERADSHYRHNVLIDGLAYSSFGHAVNSSAEILETSKYMQQLDKYLEYFPKDQILLLDFDELKEKPLLVINKIEDFVGANRSIQLKEGSKGAISNKAGVASGRRDVRQFFDKIRHLPMISFIVDKVFSQNYRAIIRKKIRQYIINSSLVRWYASLKVKRLREMQEQERKDFLSEVIPDIERLENLWGKDLSKWKV